MGSPMIAFGPSLQPKLSVTVEFADADQAAYAHMFLARTGFSDVYAATEPHLSGAERTERAYKMIHAISAIEAALDRASVPRRIYE